MRGATCPFYEHERAGPIRHPLVLDRKSRAKAIADPAGIRQNNQISVFYQPALGHGDVSGPLRSSSDGVRVERTAPGPLLVRAPY